MVNGVSIEATQTEYLRGEAEFWDCLLYTSDAADERSSVDLGGRRIINKKTKKKTQEQASRYMI